MRLIPALTSLAAASLLVAGHAEARAKPHRAHARTVIRVDRAPSHGMSALAREQARQRQLREQQRFVADAGEGVRFGAFRRDYSLNVSRPLIRPDQDGAVGFTWRMKTHD